MNHNICLMHKYIIYTYYIVCAVPAADGHVVYVYTRGTHTGRVGLFGPNFGEQNCGVEVEWENLFFIFVEFYICSEFLILCKTDFAITGLVDYESPYFHATRAVRIRRLSEVIFNLAVKSDLHVCIQLNTERNPRVKRTSFITF